MLRGEYANHILLSGVGLFSLLCRLWTLRGRMVS